MINVFTVWGNESVGKVLLMNENDVFGDLLTPPQHEIVAYRTSWENDLLISI